jgi:homoserine dehydrogenase
MDEARKPMRVIKIGLLGLGTVGASVIRILQKNKVAIEKKCGCSFEVIIACARDLEKARDCSLSGIILTTDPLEVVHHPEVEVVVELIGGTTIALGVLIEAIKNSKPVVTANKAVIALHGNELIETAKRNDVFLGFEAAIAGSIPVVKTLRESLVGNSISKIVGIVNGTCNFMLSGMSESGYSFETILKEAQTLGYAEADPSFDVDGIDAGHKLAILASLAFGGAIQFEKVSIDGIREILVDDLVYANALGYKVKHLALAIKSTSGIELRVHLTLIPKGHVLANIDGVLNAVLIDAEETGPLILSGAGAGGDATASSVISDLVSLAAKPSQKQNMQRAEFQAKSDISSEVNVLPIENIYSAYYLRIQALDKPGVLAEISQNLASSEVSIEAIRQQESHGDDGSVPIVIITRKITESAIANACKHIGNSDNVCGDIVRYRVESP